MLRIFSRYIFPDAAPRVHRSLGLKSNCKDIVLILGWGGSKQKNLKKLIAFYQERDVTVIASIMPLFVPTIIQNYYESEILRNIKQIKLEKSVEHNALNNNGINNTESRLFGHIYSNNGMWTLSSICQKKDAPIFDKFIIDSAPEFAYKDLPLDIQITKLSRVVTSVILKRSQYEHYLVTPLTKAYFYLLIPPWRFICTIQKIMNLNILPNHTEFNVYMRDYSPAIPTFFIYSKGDLLLPYKYSQEYKKVLDDRGVVTYEKIFGEDVGHTGSFFKYPIEYMEIIDNFFLLKKLT